MKTSDELRIEKANIKDSEQLLHFIKQLAEYEKLSHEVIATKEQIEKTLFGDNSNAEAIIGYCENKPVCMALYFYNYSTFKAKPGLYLEDLFVIPEMRNKGFGKKMLTHLAKIASIKNCGRFEWSVLDWNKSAINFYESIGAEPMRGWTVYRLDEDGINNLTRFMD